MSSHFTSVVSPRNDQIFTQIRHFQPQYAPSAIGSITRAVALTMENRPDGDNFQTEQNLVKSR